MPIFRVLPGLPPYGPPARTFPEGWGHGAREGLVVEFTRNDGGAWVGNFQRGYRANRDVRLHPNGSDVLVTSDGPLWHVQVERQTAAQHAHDVLGVWDVSDPAGVLYDDNGIEFVFFGADGRQWHSRRVSFDGFDKIRIDGPYLTGLSWSPVADEWIPFNIDLNTGRVEGGSYVAAAASDEYRSIFGRTLTFCWAALGAALGLVMTRAGDFPESVPAYVSPLDGSGTHWVPSTLPLVTRIPLMGVGQLLAVSALAQGATSPGWLSFFRWLAIAITVKTWLETLSLAIVGTAANDTLGQPLHLLTVLIVAMFVVYAIVAWRRGRLTAVPDIKGRARWLGVGIGIALWLACAMLPSFY